MTSSTNNRYDTLEQIIFEQGLRIVGVHCYPEMDLLLIVLNNKKVLKRKISASARLLTATPQQLQNLQLLGDGIAIHWPDVDEDLSLKGFLKEEFSLNAMEA
ncbi:MAG: hypothetical protein KIPDCIKN_00477 [Haliscomenobacter sp.]|jgi:hypothetical protein|nr:hypothetical protein [Haliscomenobacter sp.]